MSREMRRSKAVWSTAMVNNLPDSAFLYIQPGGKKDGDGKTVPRSYRHFPVRGPSGALDAAHVRNAIARIPQSNAPGLNKAALQARARKLLASAKARHQPPAKPMHTHGWAGAQADEMMEEMLPETEQRVIGGRKKKQSDRRMRRSVRARGKASLTVFKDTNGQYRWVLYSSNPYQDRDDEFVTLKAQAADVERMNETGKYGPLRWWHIGKPYFDDPHDWTTVHAGRGVDIGTCDFAAMHDRVRVESGIFLNEDIGRAISLAADELEGSIAYAHPEDQPDDGGGFLDIMTFERSLTPAMQASNPFTALLVQSKERTMDSDKLKTLKELGVDIDAVLEGAERIQRKADRKAPYRAKASSNGRVVVEDDEEEEEDDALAAKLDRLTDKLAAMEKAFKDDAVEEPEERLEDLLVGELTVAELQDVLNTAISTKAAKPTGAAFELVLDELKEIKDILTSKSITSVVDQVAKMQAKLERLSARTKGIGGKVRELEEDRPRMVQRGTRPSQSDDTLLDELSGEEGVVSEKSANPFSWIEDYVQGSSR